MSLTEADLTKKLGGATNSVGFLVRHILEVEHLFTQMFFGVELDMKFKTLGQGITDTGEHTNLEEMKHLVVSAEKIVEQGLRGISDTDWETQRETRMGLMTRAEGLSRLISHTAYHAGQIGMIAKYGN